METLRAHLKRIMAERKIGLRGLSKFTGVSVSTLSRFMRGAVPDKATVETLRRFIDSNQESDGKPLTVCRFPVGGRMFVVEIREVEE